MTVGRWSRSEMVLFEVGGLSMIIIIQPGLSFARGEVLLMTFRGHLFVAQSCKNVIDNYFA